LLQKLVLQIIFFQSRTLFPLFLEHQNGRSLIQTHLAAKQLIVGKKKATFFLSFKNSFFKQETIESEMSSIIETGPSLSFEITQLWNGDPIPPSPFHKNNTKITIEGRMQKIFMREN